MINKRKTEKISYLFGLFFVILILMGRWQGIYVLGIVILMIYAMPLMNNLEE